MGRRAVRLYAEGEGNGGRVADCFMREGEGGEGVGGEDGGSRRLRFGEWGCV